MSEVSVDALIAQCMERSPVVARWLGEENAGLTLDEFTDIQLEKHRANRTAKPLQDGADLAKICREHVLERLADRELADAVSKAVETGMLLTSDHLGGLYSPQSFQGDLLYARMVKKEYPSVSCVPVLAFGTVPLDSSTYGRGMQLFCDTGGVRYLPVYSGRYAKSVASLVPPLDEGTALAAVKAAEGAGLDADTERTVKQVLNEIYLSAEHLGGASFGDQVLYAGYRLYGAICERLGLPTVLSIEIEAVMTPLIIADLKNEASLLRMILDDGKLRQRMNDTATEDGEPVSSLLFRMADHRGRLFPLNLEPDGSLTGQSMGGLKVSIGGSPEEIEELFLQRKLLPGTYLDVLVSAFARGCTWYGGIFQSAYLPVWQGMTVRILEEEGYGEAAEKVGAVDLSGYISGPVYALADTGEGAVNAGPIEFLKCPPDGSRFDAWMKTDIGSAHRMGMFEFYHDLMYAKERNEGWYEALAKYSKRNYPENILRRSGGGPDMHDTGGLQQG